MAIFRPQEPTRDYSKSARTWARDPRISAKAKGILTNITSHSPTYELTFEQIVAEMKDDERAVRSGIKELETSGYLKRWRRRNEDGTLGGYDWQVIDYPDVFAGQDQGTKTQSGSEQGKHDDSAGGNHTAKVHPGREQGKRDVSAAQSHSAESQSGRDQEEDRVSAGGDHTAKRRTKKTKNIKEEDQKNTTSLSARTSVPGPRDPADDRERDESASPEDPNPNHDLRHHRVIKNGCPPHLAEEVVDYIEATNTIDTLGWWITADGNGSLKVQVRKAIAANTPGSNPDSNPDSEDDGPTCATCRDTGKVTIRLVHEGDREKTTDCSDCTNDGRGGCRIHPGGRSRRCGGCRADRHAADNEQPRSSQRGQLVPTRDSRPAAWQQPEPAEARKARGWLNLEID